jgi:hypothetical protein
VKRRWGGRLLTFFLYANGSAVAAFADALKLGPKWWTENAEPKP